VLSEDNLFNESVHDIVSLFYIHFFDWTKIYKKIFA
jgi:hypothetical protein